MHPQIQAFFEDTTNQLMVINNQVEVYQDELTIQGINFLYQSKLPFSIERPVSLPFCSNLGLLCDHEKLRVQLKKFLLKAGSKDKRTCRVDRFFLEEVEPVSLGSRFLEMYKLVTNILKPVVVYFANPEQVFVYDIATIHVAQLKLSVPVVLCGSWGTICRNFIVIDGAQPYWYFNPLCKYLILAQHLANETFYIIFTSLTAVKAGKKLGFLGFFDQFEPTFTIKPNTRLARAFIDGVVDGLSLPLDGDGTIVRKSIQHGRQFIVSCLYQGMEVNVGLVDDQPVLIAKKGDLQVGRRVSFDF